MQLGLGIFRKKCAFYRVDKNSKVTCDAGKTGCLLCLKFTHQHPLVSAAELAVQAETRSIAKLSLIVACVALIVSAVSFFAKQMGWQ